MFKPKYRHGILKKANFKCNQCGKILADFDDRICAWCKNIIPKHYKTNNFTESHKRICAKCVKSYFTNQELKQRQKLWQK